MSWSMESVHEAAAAPAAMYRFCADPPTWGQRAHNAAWGRGRSPLQPGYTVEVRVRSYPWTYAVPVRALVPAAAS